MNQYYKDQSLEPPGANPIPPGTNGTAKSGAFKLSSNPKKAMQEMMDAIDELRFVYEQETSALMESDAKRFLALQDNKLATARNYQRGIEQMLERKEEMKNADPELRTKLRDMQADFSQLARKNMVALERMQKAMDRFGGTLREAAKEAVKKDRATSYTANGAMAIDEVKQISTGISETA